MEIRVHRPLFTLIIGIGRVLFGFQATSTGTSLNQSWKQESREAQLPTSSCPNTPYIYSFRQWQQVCIVQVNATHICKNRQACTRGLEITAAWYWIKNWAEPWDCDMNQNTQGILQSYEEASSEEGFLPYEEGAIYKTGSPLRIPELQFHISPGPRKYNSRNHSTFSKYCAEIFKHSCQHFAINCGNIYKCEVREDQVSYSVRMNVVFQACLSKLSVGLQSYHGPSYHAM